MRLLLLGGFGGSRDEGMRNIAYNLFDIMRTEFEVLALNPKEYLSSGFWKEVSVFDPELIHYVPGPSLQSFLFMRMLALRFPKAKLIMSASHPMLSEVSMQLARLMRPDLILVESCELERWFILAGFNVEKVIFTTVDMDRFAPITLEQKTAIRRKWNVPEDKYVVLHVGQNFSLMADLHGGNGMECICVAPSESRADRMERLERVGGRVIKGFVPNIEELFQMADCYVFFSTGKNDCVQLPLSVLEAMACNIPVVTTRFGALPELFHEGDGLVYVNGTVEDLRRGIEVARSTLNVRNRINVEVTSKLYIKRWLTSVYQRTWNNGRMTS